MNNLIKENAIRTLEIESDAISLQVEHINNEFVDAVNCLSNCDGKIVISGIGKSGIIGRKFAASLASTGTPSFFIHPSEAFHGDLGMISSNDVVFLISYSGETDEILKLFPFLKKTCCQIVSLTSSKNSSMAKNSTFNIISKVKTEACPLNLAPTSSTTATLALTDAIVVSLMKLKNFKKEDFAAFHPGGSLGRRLLTKVDEIMLKNDLPIVQGKDSLMDVVTAISKSTCGVAVVQNHTKYGIITDGDIRRAMENDEAVFFKLCADDIASQNPKSVKIGSSILQAEVLFKSNDVNTLLVLSEDSKLCGILKVKDVLF